MNDNDLRDCFAMFKASTGASPDECYIFADAMLEARKPKEEAGITAVKRARKSSEKRDA